MEKVSMLLNLILLLAVLNSGQAAVLKTKESINATKIDLRRIGEYMKLEMPCMDLAPFRLDFHKFEMEQPTWSVKGNLTNFTLDGLNHYDIAAYNWNTTSNQINFDFNFPKLKISSSYKIYGVYNKTGTPKSVFGNGLFRLELIDLNMKGNFKLVPAVENKGLTVTDFDLKMNLKESHSTSTGFMNDTKSTEAFNFSVEKIVNLLISEQKLSNFLKSMVELNSKNQPFPTSLKYMERYITLLNLSKEPLKPMCNKKEIF